MSVPIDVASFKLIEGHIKELEGECQTPSPGLRTTKSPGRIGLSPYNQNILYPQSFYRSVWPAGGGQILLSLRNFGLNCPIDLKFGL